MRLVPFLLAFGVWMSSVHAESAAKDAELARFEKLASEGDSAAITELELRYQRGWGLKQDDALAYDWYMKAIES